jgi:hypothetical protein
MALISSLHIDSFMKGPVVLLVLLGIGIGSIWFSRESPPPESQLRTTWEPSLKPTTTEAPPILEMYPLNQSEAFLSTLSLQVRRLYLEQARLDDIYKAHIPMLYSYMENPVLEEGPVTTRISHLIAHQATCNIFSLESLPEKIIKYQSDCLYLGGVHPLLRDFWALSAINETNIGPKIFFLSPAVRLSEYSSTPKANFKLGSQAEKFCIQNNGTVRYMIMERLTTSVDQLVIRRGPLRLRHSMTALKHLILTIQELHAQGIVHRDIHPGNVMFGSSLRDVRLIDFELAQYSEEMEASPESAPELLGYSHCYLSHWNMDGSRFSYRDDVFKAIFVGAFMLNGKKFIEYCVSLQAKPSELMDFKKSSFMFEIPGGRRIDSPVLKTELEKILDLSRSVVGIDDQPPYEEILKALDRILQYQPS